MKQIAIFASGNGSNAQCIMEYFDQHPQIKVALILSNKKDAYVLQRTMPFGIPTITFTKRELAETSIVLDTLKRFDIDFIVLAGFLLKIPDNILATYTNKIINIHPALLPKYGGAGMYGDRVHQAVLDSKDKESGITIHYVNDHYDEGQIIFQAKCFVQCDDTTQTLAEKVHRLEHTHYPIIIEKLLLSI